MRRAAHSLSALLPAWPMRFVGRLGDGTVRITALGLGSASGAQERRMSVLEASQAEYEEMTRKMEHRMVKRAASEHMSGTTTPSG